MNDLKNCKGNQFFTMLPPLNMKNIQTDYSCFKNKIIKIW